MVPVSEARVTYGGPVSSLLDEICKEAEQTPHGVTLVKSLVKQGLHYKQTRNQYVKARYSIRVLMNQGG
jgi:hypothetical protein